MASAYERPDQAALAKLEPLARKLAEELTALRARAQRAEADAAELRSKGGALAGPELLQVRQRIVDLERAFPKQGLAVDLRYSFFANELSEQLTSFRRHVVYLGLTYRFSTR